MRASDLQTVTKIDETIANLHHELHELYMERIKLLTSKAASKRPKKSSLEELDLSSIDLSLQ